MTTLLQNFRLALRLLWKNPGFTIVAVITLALGIGANTAIFSVVYSTLLEPMPYPSPNQLVVVWSKANGGNNVVSSGDFLDWKRQNSTFQYMGAWTANPFNLATGEQPQEINGQLTTPGLYSTMGVKFSLGRDFIPEEGEFGKDQELILVNRLWRRLGSDPNIIGKQLRVDGKPYTVVGVMAPGSADRLYVQMIAPLAFKPEQISHSAHWILVMGRLKPGVTLAAAQADMAVVTSRIAKANPQTNKGWGANVEPLHNDFFPKDTQRTLWFLLGAVGFVLLIACANVANLLLAKATTRFKEVAVRSSLGATRSRVFSQFLTESVTLAFIGGVAGIVLSAAMLKALLILMPTYTLPSEADVRLSVPVLVFTLLATLVAGILFGCASAWKVSAINLNEPLKEGGRSGTGRGRHNLRRGLVIAEFGLALTLLAGAGLAIHSFWNLTRVDLGTRTDHILTFELHIQPQHFASAPQVVTFYRQLLDKLHALPGVSNAEIGTGTPLEGTYFGMNFDVVGQPKTEAGSRRDAGFQMVTPDYFKTFGIQLLKGRSFTEQDLDGSPRVAMVNEDFVRRCFPGVDPIGQRLTIEQLLPAGSKLGPEVDWEIVGVFHTVRSGGFKNDNYPEIDVPFYQSPWPSVNGAIRTSGDPEIMTKSVAAAVASMDPDIALAHVKTMDQVLDSNLLSDRFITVLYLTFAVVALLLAAVGIYGVMAFSVAQRTHEIGLRMALGADRKQVLGLVLKEGIVLALIGLGLGLGGAYFVGRAIRGTLYGVGNVDFMAFGVVSVLLLSSALFACYFPARRATKVDPMVALRYE